ncbi:MAG: NADH-quinone oxidoreductase subunit N [Chloroflexaceae bacterium]|nr:NADH-quinone oxidoreductase subunit N [Chloroflexaceae bacterium]
MNIAFPDINMLVILPLIVIFGSALALLLIDLFFIPAGNKKITGYLALAGLLFTGLAGVPLWGMEESSFSGMVVVDTFALTLNVIFIIIAAITIIISLDYLPRQGIEQGEFYPLILFATGSFVLLAQSTNLILIFLGIELLSITLYVLTGFAYPRLSSEEAAMKYLLLGAFAAGFFVYGIALIYGETMTVDLNQIRLYLTELESSSTAAVPGPTLLLIGGALVLIAFSFKIALVPFHMWTPDVYEGAPTPVTAFMSVGTKGAALAALIRIVTIALPTVQDAWVPVLAVLAAATMIVGNVGAVAQTNVKRMLAYSSVGHAGYIVLGVVAMSAHGIEAFLFYLLAYSLTNLGAFAVIIVLEQRGESAWSLDDFSGLGQRQPMLAVAMALFMLSLAGVPPTAGYLGKFFVFAAAWESGLGWLVLIGVITSAIAIFFYLRIIVRMFMHEPVRDVQPALHRSITWTIAVAAGAVLLFGFMPNLFIDLAQRSVIALGG